MVKISLFGLFGLIVFNVGAGALLSYMTTNLLHFAWIIGATFINVLIIFISKNIGDNANGSPS